VKDRAICRVYVRREDGNISRHKFEGPDANESAEIALAAPQGVEVIKAAKLSCCGKTKLILKLAWADLFDGDFMLWLALYASFVSQMLTAKAGCLIFSWLMQWLSLGGGTLSDVELEQQESLDTFSNFKLASFISAFVLIPFFGCLAEKLDIGLLLLLSFGLRTLAGFAFFVMDNAQGVFVVVTLVVIAVSGSLQAMLIDSIFTKRLAADERGFL